MVWHKTFWKVQLSMMKQLTFILAVCILQHIAKAQQVTGLWYNTDSSRIYEIKQSCNEQYEAVIKNSSRKTDSAGFCVIKYLHYNNRKKRFEGIMYAAADKQPCFVKITAANNRLILKLSRMYVFDAVLTWSRAGGHNLPAEM